MNIISILHVASELIISLSYWLWPIVALVFLLIFKSDVKSLLNRMLEGEILGQKFKFSEDIDKFQKVTEIAVEEVEKPISDEKLIQEIPQFYDKDIQDILKAALVKPELGIIALSAILEKEVRISAASVGVLEQNYPKVLPIKKLFLSLIEKGYLPKHVAESLNLFWELRNQIVHGHTPTVPERDILRVLDIGLSLLRMIRIMLFETNKR